MNTIKQRILILRAKRFISKMRKRIDLCYEVQDQLLLQRDNLRYGRRTDGT